MSSSLRRGALAATAAFSMIPLAACGAGFEAETDLVSPINASVEAEDIQVQNVNVVVNDEGAAAVSGRIFNSGTDDQTLLAITLPDSGETFDLLPAEDTTEIVVPAGGSVPLGGEGNPAAFIENAEDADIVLGNAQHLSFDLSDTGAAQLHATVVPAGDDRGAFAYYEEYGPDMDRVRGDAAEEADEDLPGGSEGATDEDGADADDAPGGADDAESSDDAGSTDDVDPEDAEEPADTDTPGGGTDSVEGDGAAPDEGGQ